MTGQPDRGFLRLRSRRYSSIHPLNSQVIDDRSQEVISQCEVRIVVMIVHNKRNIVRLGVRHLQSVAGGEKASHTFPRCFLVKDRVPREHVKSCVFCYCTKFGILWGSGMVHHLPASRFGSNGGAIEFLRGV